MPGKTPPRRTVVRRPVVLDSPEVGAEERSDECAGERQIVATLVSGVQRPEIGTEVALFRSSSNRYGVHVKAVTGSVEVALVRPSDSRLLADCERRNYHFLWARIIGYPTEESLLIATKGVRT